MLGHLQRGGSPVMTDRVLALRLGCAATRFIADTTTSGLVAIRGNAIQLVPIADGTARIRTVPLDSDVLLTGRQLGICFGDGTARIIRALAHTATAVAAAVPRLQGRSGLSATSPHHDRNSSIADRPPMMR